MSDDFYTYELAYPESMGGAVFYIGKGRGNRIDDHEREARNGVQSYKCHVIRKIWQAGEQVIKRKMNTHLSEEQAYALECQLISKCGRETLTNMTDGGEGGPGRAVTRKGTYKVITLEIKRDLLRKIDASGKSRREYIEEKLSQN